MNSPRVQVGIHADHDMRHWQFSRSSGLPLDYFKRHGRIDWTSIGDVLAVVAAVGVIVAAVTGVLS
jgi:hypothetical protein